VARLATLLHDVEVSTVEDGRLSVSAPPERVGEIAAANGIVLHELTSQRATLEEVFLELTAPEETR
jgi:ABC-2 type transport system ATP-binding protein